MRATTGDRPKHIGDERMQYYTCQPGSTQPTRVNPEKPGRPTTIVASQFFSRYALYTLVATRRTDTITLASMPKIAIVCAQVMACACSASLVSHRLCFIHSHTHSYSIARSSRMPWRRCSRPARATAPRTFTHGPVGRGSQASPPACMPCHVLSLASSPPHSLSPLLSLRREGRGPLFPIGRVEARTIKLTVARARGMR